MQSSGFTLVELLVVLALIAITSTIAMPLYQNYITTARQGVMTDNIQAIRLLQEGLRLSGGGTYQAGTYDPGNPNAAGGLNATIGWKPTTDDITYKVETAENDTTYLKITATHSNGDIVEWCKKTSKGNDGKNICLPATDNK